MVHVTAIWLTKNRAGNLYKESCLFMVKIGGRFRGHGENKVLLQVSGTLPAGHVETLRWFPELSHALRKRFLVGSQFNGDI